MTDEERLDQIEARLKRIDEKLFVLVPRTPTPVMLKEGWYEAHAENAAGVWRDMIEAWKKESK